MNIFRKTGDQRFSIGFGGIFAAAGLLSLYPAIAFGLIPLLSPDDTFETTTATVTDISADSTVVSYEVDGMQYSARLNDDFATAVGAQIEISYSLQNPSEIRQPDEAWQMLGGFGSFVIVFSAVGWSFIAHAVKQRNRTKRLLTDGHQITGEIIKTQLAGSSRDSWQIYCRGYLPESEKLMDFYSPVWKNDPEDLIKGAAITTLPIYLDPKNPKINYVDDSQLRDQI